MIPAREAIKGGGGGAFGVLTKLTLRTRELPTTFGAVFGTIKAASDTAFRDLVGKTLTFYADKLFNPHWGEQIAFGKDNTVRVFMVFPYIRVKRVIFAPFAGRLLIRGRER